MATFLSDPWITAMDEAAKGIAGGARFVIQQVVTGEGDAADTTWHVILSDDAVRVQPGRADAPDVTFTQDRVTAEAIAGGEMTAGAALTSGQLTVRGRTAELTAHRDVLRRLEEAWREVATGA